MSQEPHSLSNPIPQAGTKKNRVLVVVPDEDATEPPPYETEGTDDAASPDVAPPTPPPVYIADTPYSGGFEATVAPPEYEKVAYTEVKPSRSPNKRLVWIILGVSVSVGAIVGLITGVTLYALSSSALGGWGEWGAWGSCDVTCGQGWMTRTRECHEDKCAGNSHQVAQCTMQQCPSPEVPAWSSWQAWSECSVTCGDGQQSRERTCESTACPGDTTQSRACPGWSCPDCSEPCPGGGSWNGSCTWCECPGTDLTGRVLSTVNTPLPGVTLSPAQAPFVTVGTTDALGAFTINDVCMGQILLLKKPGYVDLTYEVTGTTAQISLIKLEPLKVTTHPQSKARLVGESATLCCTAIGSPPPEYYEWFKDSHLVRTVVTSGSSVLVLDDLQEEQEGEYRCRANNDFSAVYSEAVTLQVKASPSAYCSPYPMSHVIQLPLGCHTQDGASMYDVGKCQELPCQHPAANHSTACHDPKQFCCGATSSARVDLVCDEAATFIFEVTGCGCSECQNTSLQISGHLQAADTLEAVPYGQVKLPDGLTVYADVNGQFSLTVPSVQHRVALTATDVYGNFVETTIVVYVNDPSSVTSVNIRLMRKAEPVAFDPSSETFLPMGGSGGRAVFAGIRVPPGSVYAGDGSRFTGEARARLNVIDPRESSQIENAPGDFTVVNDEGESQLLDTFGMFNLHVEDLSGNPLQVQGDIEISLDAALAGDVIPNIYSLDSNGQWVEEVSMQKGQVRGVYAAYFSSVIIGNVTVPVTDTTINLDYVSGNPACISKVRLYKTDAYVQEIKGARPYVVVTGNSIAQRYSHLLPSKTGYCIAHPCDVTYDTKRKGYFLVEYDRKQAIPVSDSNIKDHGVQDEQLKQRINYKSLGDSISVDLSYYKQQSTNGPFYTLSKPKYSYACDVATASENHFRFHQEDGKLECGDTEDFRVLEFPTGTIDNINYYAWYANVNEFQAIYIKVTSTGSMPTMLQAISTVGNNTRGGVKVGDQYGYSLECKDKGEAVCLEVKPSGVVSNGATTGIDETVIRVQTVLGQSREFCTGYRISDALNAYVKHPTPDFVASHQFELRLGDVFRDQHSHNQGVYWARRGDNDNEAKTRARKACETGSNAQFLSGDGINRDNYAIEFVCS